MNKFIEIIDKKIVRDVGFHALPSQLSAAKQAYMALSSAKRWIWICGSVGSGKTTTARALAQSVAPYHHFQKAIDITELALLKDLTKKDVLIVDDAGKNPQKINYMGVYTQVLPYLFHMRDEKGLTIITSQHKFESLLSADVSLLDRFKSIGVQIIINERSLR